MITKISLGLFAVSVGAVFVLGLIETVRKDVHAVKKCMIQFLIFFMICAPIGLSWTIHNSVKFDMEANYVPDVGVESGQYIGDKEWKERLGIPSEEQRNYAKIQYNPTVDTNIWMSLFRTALYDEERAFGFNSEVAERAGRLVLFLNIFIAIFSLVVFFNMIFKRSATWDLAGRILLGLTYGVYFISYLKFCFEYPYICTMNFRYIAFLVVLPMIGMGIWLKKNENGMWMKFLAFICMFTNGLANLLFLKYCMFF